MRSLVERYDRLIRYTIFQTSRRHCERDPGWLDARANETWTGIVQSLRRSGPSKIPPQISGYFVRIAKNKCLDASKRADARSVIPIEEGRADLVARSPLSRVQAIVRPLLIGQGANDPRTSNRPTPTPVRSYCSRGRRSWSGCRRALLV